MFRKIIFSVLFLPMTLGSLNAKEPLWECRNEMDLYYRTVGVGYSVAYIESYLYKMEMFPEQKTYYLSKIFTHLQDIRHQIGIDHIELSDDIEVFSGD